MNGAPIKNEQQAAIKQHLQQILSSAGPSIWADLVDQFESSKI